MSNRVYYPDSVLNFTNLRYKILEISMKEHRKEAKNTAEFSHALDKFVQQIIIEAIKSTTTDAEGRPKKKRNKVFFLSIYNLRQGIKKTLEKENGKEPHNKIL